MDMDSMDIYSVCLFKVFSLHMFNVFLNVVFNHGLITPVEVPCNRCNKTKQTVGDAGGPVFALIRANRLYRDAACDHVFKFPDCDNK